MILRIKLLAILALVAAMTVHAAQKSDSAKTMLEAAKKKGLIDGDLNAAIQQYKAIVTKFKDDRATVAEALIGMADSYQKLDSTESRKIYETILRDYSDQKEAAAIARTHVLPIESASAAKGDRAVWSGGFVDGFGTISRDGRFLTYTDWSKGAVLMIRDLVTGIDRQLTKGDAQSTGSGAEFSVISKDGKQVVYWFNSTASSGKRGELRIASLTGTGIPEYRLVLQSDEIPNIAPMDWSPDGKWIAARLERKDGTFQIALVSAQDGAVRILKSIGWSDRSGKIFFSPDGKYLAYALTRSDDASKSQILVMAVDGSRETAADAYPSLNQIMGWSPDGKHLLFVSDRSGSLALWAIPVADGKPQGQPMIVKPDIGQTLWSMGITASGTLYTWKNTGSTYVQVLSVDLNTGKLQGPPSGVFQQFIASRGRPEWSADGKQLAYESCGAGGAGPCSLFIWSAKTGQVREVKHQLNYFQHMSWAPDGRELLVSGNDIKGKAGIYRIDAETGAVSVVVEGAAGYAQWTLDGKAIYYKPNKRRDLILKRDLATGAESEFHTSAGSAYFFSVSPDGRSIALVSSEGSTTNVVVIPLEAGQPRNVFHASMPEQIRSSLPLNWTPDGRALILLKTFDGNSRKELWEVPVDGRQPRKLDIDTTHWDVGEFRLSPDGKQIAFVGAAGKSGSEIWAFEHLTPSVRPSN